jgi:hypothetical protein
MAMKKVKVTKTFPWAADGNHVRYVKPGEVLDGRGAEVALQMGAGEVLPEAEPARPQSAPPSESPKHRGR